MNKYLAGLLAGFIATVVLSALMLLKGAMGLLPDMNVIKMLAGMGHGMLGLPMSPVVGWIAHFVIGAVAWGLLYALLRERLPGLGDVVKGMWFGAGAWLLMMLVTMPIAGAGLFGMNIGLMAPVMTLILHLIFGAVLGLVVRMSTRSAQAAHA